MPLPPPDNRQAPKAPAPPDDAHSAPDTPAPPLTTPRDPLAAAIALYRDGWFPMADPDQGTVDWVQPHERAMIPLEPGAFRIGRSLRARIRQQRFIITTDLAFSEVIRACAQPRPGRKDTWLDQRIITLFEHFHTRGVAHSIEAWLDIDGRRILVGGLYGLAMGRIFAGESMFSRPELGGTDASKVCLVHLVHHLRRRQFQILDTQILNDHLAQFGAREIPREAYLALVARWSADNVNWLPFEPDSTIPELRGH